MTTDDLRVVLRTVLEGHRSVETGLWGVVSCTCRRHGMMSRPEYDEHAARMQVDAVLTSDWISERDRLVAERAWDEGYSERRKYEYRPLPLARNNPYEETT